METQVELVADKVLDATGLFCPEPVMLLHKAVREMEPGAVLQVLATDPSTQRDIPKFCAFLEHSLLASDEQDEQYRYWIRKKLK
ncbi:MAG: sulfurtransferase TusA [Gammaproteobacteria bacterium]|nr:sulfurtransferase TusA [Gammaproteobacteria bacterium]